MVKKSICSACYFTMIYAAVASAGKSKPTSQEPLPKQAHLLRTLHQSKGTRDIAFSPDGRLLATLDADKAIQVWDVKTWKVKRVFRSGGNYDETAAIAFSPDGKTLAVAGSTLKLWSLQTGRVRLLRGSALDSVAFSPNGEFIATGAGMLEGAASRATVSNVKTGKAIWTHEVPTESVVGVRNVEFSADGRTLATVGDYVHLWDARTGKRSGKVGGNRDLSNDVAFSRDGKTLVIAGDDIHLYNPQTKKLRRTIAVSDTILWAIALSPDNHLVAATTRVGKKEKVIGDIRIWNKDTGQLLQRPLKLKAAGGQVTFSSKGKLLAGVDDYIVYVWQMR